MKTQKIIGESFIVEEVTKKERITKNIKTETIVRTTTRAILLECGHKVSVVNLNKVPKLRRDCWQCPT